MRDGNLKLDKFHLIIARALHKNSKSTQAEIGGNIGLASCSISRRVDDLEEHGYIERYSAILNWSKFGFTETRFVLVRLKTHDADRIRDFVGLITQRPRVMAWAQLETQWDFILMVVSRDTPHYAEFRKELTSACNYIERLESLLVTCPTNHLNWQAPMLPI